MLTELPFVLFHDSRWLFLRIQAFNIILECIILLLDNNLTLHASVPETAGMATVERIGACHLGKNSIVVFPSGLVWWALAVGRCLRAVPNLGQPHCSFRPYGLKSPDRPLLVAKSHNRIHTHSAARGNIGSGERDSDL
jgi:hypothetical protein